MNNAADYVLTVLVVCLLAFGAVALAYTVYHIVVINLLFRYDERNPARRRCKRCGAVQEKHVWNHDPRPFHPGSGWWEEVSAGRSTGCVCHEFQEYKTPYGSKADDGDQEGRGDQ